MECQGITADLAAEQASALMMVAVAIAAGMAQAGSCDLFQVERVAQRLADSLRGTHQAAPEYLDTFVAMLELAKPTQ